MHHRVGAFLLPKYEFIFVMPVAGHCRLLFCIFSAEFDALGAKNIEIKIVRNSRIVKKLLNIFVILNTPFCDILFFV